MYPIKEDETRQMQFDFNETVECAECNKPLEFVPAYKKYLEEYLGCTVEEAIKKGAKFVCHKCEEVKA